MEHPTGDADDGSLLVDFDRRLKLEFHGSRVTSDAGLLAYRELDDALGLSDLAGAALSECRRGKNTRHLLAGLFRQSVFGQPRRVWGCKRRRTSLPRSGDAGCCGSHRPGSSGRVNQPDGSL